MAERRMFAKTIIDSDAFLDMPLSAQALYFHLSMRADDEGFVNNPKKIQRMVGASDDDCKLLIMKRFILTFESGVIVIKHWRIHNYIRNDRFKETVYVKEKSTLTLNENNAYTEVDTVGIPSDNQVVYQMDTQVRLGKDRLGKDITTTTTGEPTMTEVYVYFKSLSVDDAPKEAEKFHAYNANKGWSCLPDWKATADLWIARIGER
jgi:hypothetical protein